MIKKDVICISDNAVAIPYVSKQFFFCIVDLCEAALVKKKTTKKPLYNPVTTLKITDNYYLTQHSVGVAHSYPVKVASTRS